MKLIKIFKKKTQKPDLTLIKEGKERGNNKIVTSPRPNIIPAPQKPIKNNKKLHINDIEINITVNEKSK